MIIRVIGLYLIIVGISTLIIKAFFVKKNNNVTTKKDNNGNYAFLIPARNESKVIEGLLKSIKNQTRKIPSKNVYVIVEDKKDPTVEIVNKYQMNIVFRHDLSLRKIFFYVDVYRYKYILLFRFSVSLL